MRLVRTFAVQTKWREVGSKGLLLWLFLTGFASIAVRAQQTDNEKAVWKLESAYWEDVKALDLVKYKDLWHDNFVGWPSVSAQPVRKDHITDWIAAYTDKGSRLQWYSLEPAASQSTGDLVITHYWLTAFWADKTGDGKPVTTRVTHTWIKTSAGWKIISGMSALAS